MTQTRTTLPEFFTAKQGAPRPLIAKAARKVRFEEVDPLGIVWHGRYPSYFEDARMAFGEKYGIGYLEMHREQFLAPIVQMHIEYHRPLFFGNEFSIEISMHWTDAVKMNCSYSITDDSGNLATTGYTVQLLTDMEGNVHFVRPPFVEKFCEKWKNGEFDK